MKYAIIQYAGTQLKVEEGQTFKIERQKDFDVQVLFYKNDDEVIIGEPIVKDVVVKGKIIGEERAKKVRVARYKSKSRYHKVKGHRQPLSVIQIESITKKGEKPAAKKAEKKADEKVEAASVTTETKETKKPAKKTVKPKTTKKSVTKKSVKVEKNTAKKSGKTTKTTKNSKEEK